MSEDENPYFFDFNGEEVCIDEACLAKLLQDEVLFANGRRYICDYDGEQPETIVLFVNCNDIFAWACADAEPLPLKEVGPLFKMHQSDPTWGAARWCCFRRNQKPQGPVIEAMKRDGSWDERMETLGENTLDAETQALFASMRGKS